MNNCDFCGRSYYLTDQDTCKGCGASISSAWPLLSDCVIDRTNAPDLIELQRRFAAMDQVVFNVLAN